MSKFKEAFAKARKGGAKEFDFGGKKFNTKLKAEGGSKKSSSLPKKAPVPTSRASAISSMSKKPSFSSLTEAGKSVPDKYSKPQSPSKRGGGPKIAMSKANMDKRKGSAGAKASASGGFSGAMKKVVNSIKMGG